MIAQPAAAVVVGGAGTILVVALIASFWPEMRRLGTLSEAKSEKLPLQNN